MWKQVESLIIGWIRDSQFETNLFNSGFVIYNTIQTQDLFCKARIEPFWSQDSWLWYDTNPWIRKTNPCFSNLLLSSRNLVFLTSFLWLEIKITFNIIFYLFSTAFLLTSLNRFPKYLRTSLLRSRPSPGFTTSTTNPSISVNFCTYRKVRLLFF